MKRILPVITMIFALAGLTALTLMQLFTAAESPPEEKPAQATADEAAPLDADYHLFRMDAPHRGYVTILGRTYYYDADGVMQKGGIVGSAEEGYTLADENGVCCISEEIKLAADFLMRHGAGDTLDERLKTAFSYLSNRIAYQRSYVHTFRAQDMADLAIDMFTNERGNCYRYAACFACMAKIAGYRARVVLGTTVGNPHGWVEVRVGQRWLLCDPDAEMVEKNRPEYCAYMMERHIWQITSKQRIELTINSDGVAVWQ